MRLSQLLKLKQELQTQNSDKIESTVNDAIGHINQMAMGADRLDQANLFQSITAEYRKIYTSLREVDKIKQEKIRELDEAVSVWDKQYFIDSYEMYETQHKKADVATNRDIRKLYIYENVKHILKSRIYRYVDWRYPALEIGPGDGEYTQFMSAGDPLYIVDVHQEFLDSTKKQFNEFYATRRLRSYLIKNNYDLSMLPQKQMGFVLAWNVFNYFPLEGIKTYLKEISKVMRPGGYLLFSYNNSERWQNAEMVENAFMCHTPKHILLPLVESLGFELIASSDYDPTVSWLELQKVGELKTCKAHQAMGAVIQLLDPDEDQRSVEARAREELRASIEAQKRFELSRTNPEIIEKAREYRVKYNLTLEKAIERVITGEENVARLDKEEDKRKEEERRREEENRQREEDRRKEERIADRKRRAFDVSELAKSLQLKYHTYTKEQCIRKALEKYGYEDLTIHDIDY